MDDPKSAPCSQSPLVLIVDDMPVIVNTVTKCLEHLDYRIISAANGLEGLRAASKEIPDVIISDIQMPQMDGWTMIKSLRVLMNFAFTPIIILTTMSTNEDRAKGFQCGADDFVNKEYIFGEIGFRVAKGLAAARLQKRCAHFEMEAMARGDSGFSGRLDEFRLSSLITLCRLENTSGLLEIETDCGETGLVSVRNGEVISAKTIAKVVRKNEMALCQMLRWSAGSFSLVKQDTSHIPNEIATSTDSLLLSAATEIDENPAAEYASAT